MKRILLLALLTTAPLLAKSFDVPDGLEKHRITFTVPDSTEWAEVWNLPVLQQRVVTYVPQGESVDDWSEIITVQFFNLSLTEPAEFVALFEQNVKEACAEATLNIIDQSPTQVTWEWRLPTDSVTGEPQHEITRIIRADDGWFRVAYTKRVPKLSDGDRSAWVAAIETAKVKQ